MAADPTIKGAWLVKGEVDVGPQRRCRDCRQFWPLESSCWLMRSQRHYRRRWRRDSGTLIRHYYIQPCRSCRSERGMATG